MKNDGSINEALNKNGFAIVNDIFSQEEVNRIIAAIENTESNNPSFRRAKDLFAIRRFLQEIPEIVNYIFTERFTEFIKQHFGNGYFVTKSIYFDKPETSNWFIPYHQDLTIAVDKKLESEGFGSWTVKQNYFAVQPPVSILQNNFTIRIHLDDTDADNGALRVIPASHKNGIVNSQSITEVAENETICAVEKGGIMLIKPLLLHASGRTLNGRKRRVIHIEFGSDQLPTPMQWAEYMPLKITD